MRVYYAHCMALYYSPQERRDIATLEKLGLTVVNPGTSEHSESVAALKAAGVDDYMLHFKAVVGTCEALAFRALPDGRIPAGVAREIAWARELKLPIIELPSNVLGRAISVEETREYLAEVGER